MKLPLKRRIVAIAITSAFVLTPLSAVSAHTLKTDGEISAILHVDPDDHPISGEPTPFLLLYGDTSNRFSTSLCTCTVVIKEHGKKLHSQTLQPTYKFEDDGLFTFPKGDVYDLILSGKPNKPKAFQPFTIAYLLRVDQGKPLPQPFPWVWICIGVALFVVPITAIFVVILYTKPYKKGRAQKKR